MGDIVQAGAVEEDGSACESGVVVSDVTMTTKMSANSRHRKIYTYSVEMPSHVTVYTPRFILTGP